MPDTVVPAEGVPLLQMRDIGKSFPGVRALGGVDLTVRGGEVHCLLGQNGAGKSTLIKVLAGVHAPDEGTIRLRGEESRLESPQAALRRGIATVYQELDLVDGLSVAENIFLGHEPSAAGVTRRRVAESATTELMRRLGHPEIAARTEVGTLRPGARQIVSMARALSHVDEGVEGQIVIMDEPTAVLDEREVEELFALIGALRNQGAAVIYISHRLEEIRRIGDRITVLKDGRTTASDLPVSGTTTGELVSLMTGRVVEAVYPERTPQERVGGPILEVESLGRTGEFTGVTLDVRPGEIVGLAGLVGSGRSEILETIYGARKADTGRVRVGGARLRAGSVTSAVRAGVGLCPEERKSQGLVLDASIADNVTLSTFARYARGPMTRRRAESAAATEAARQVHLHPLDVERITRTLSGGNQQKVVLARWLLTDCRVLLLDEPTRGVDVGARAEIYRLIDGLAQQGVAVLLVSSEIDEVLGLSDRVAVVADGAIVRVADSADLDEHRVLDLIMEGKPA